MKNLYFRRSLTGCLVISLLIVLAMASWTDRSLDYWLSHFKGVPVDCPFWLSTLATLAAPAALLLNIVSEIARLCV